MFYCVENAHQRINIWRDGGEKSERMEQATRHADSAHRPHPYIPVVMEIGDMPSCFLSNLVIYFVVKGKGAFLSRMKESAWFNVPPSTLFFTKKWQHEKWEKLQEKKTTTINKMIFGGNRVKKIKAT